MFDILRNIAIYIRSRCYDRHFSRTPGIDCSRRYLMLQDTRMRRVAFKCRMHRERDIQPHYQDACRLEFSIYLRDTRGIDLYSNILLAH